MKTTQTKWQWWWLVILMTAFVMADVRADNPCIEGGPYTNYLDCLSHGTLSPGYGLLPTNLTAGVGQFIVPPTAVNLSVTNGLESYYVTYDCTPTGPYGWQTNSPNYTFNIYYIPTIPSVFWTAGTYTYTGMVAATGSPCSPTNNTLGTVTINVVSNNPDVLLDVDFGNQASSLKTGYAVIGDSPSDFWNEYSQTNSASGSLANLLTAEGVVSPVGLLVTNLPVAGTNGSTDAMYDDYLGTNTGTATLTFTNLPSGTWNVYLYADDGSYTLSSGGNNYGTQTCQDSLPGSSPAWQQGVQFAVFQSVVVTNGQPVTVTINLGINGVAMISGLQIASPTHHVLPPPFSISSSVVAWGLNNYGQTNVPAGLTNVVAIASGANHSLALKNDGTVVAWGWNEYGFGQTIVPAGLTNVVAVAGGVYHSLVLKSDGTVVAWGNNGDGQTNVPAGLTNVVAIASGFFQNLALKSDGTVVAWGNNSYGQTSVPAGLTNVVAIAGGGNHSLGLKSDGTVVAWGNNSSGQTNVPAGLSNVVAIAGGGFHSLALKNDGTVVAWGLNTSGQTNVPASLTSVVAIAGGYNDSLALKSDGTVVAWGNNSHGQTNVPVGLTNVVAIAAGQYHDLALINPAIPSGQIASMFRAGAPGSPSVTADSDYDGVSDLQELADRTNPNDANSVPQIRLGYWPFDNTNTWVGSAGQLPLMATNVTGVPSWSTNAVLIDNTNGAVLTYRDVETNGNANLNLRNGSVRFWFKPDWSSVDQGGTGPQSEGRLIEMGAEGSTSGWWGLVVGSAGTNIYFGTQSSATNTLITNLTATISWSSNLWHQVVLTYNTTNTALYIDGQPVAGYGIGVTNYPGLAVRANGFTIGSSASGTNQARGAFDELQTFNYSLTQVAALAGYQAATSPPIITNQPASLTVVQGANGTFNVGATGTAPLTYQWRYNSANISGATAGSFTTNNVASGSAGNYSVIVANFYGSVTSAPAVLTVNVPVSITQQPTNLTVVQGANATFSLGANGTLPLSYQWYFNGSNGIPWANASTYTKLVAVPADDGNYNASVSNVVGGVTSSNASLTVIVPPIINQQPTNLTVNLTSNATFSVSISTNSTTPLNYQWLWNGNILSGATNALLTVTNVQATNVGYYSVVVTNTAGSNTSTLASLTVTLLGAGLTNTSALQLNGNAAYANTGDGRVLELTPATINQHGSAFFLTPILLVSNASFSTFFTFRLSNTNNAGEMNDNGIYGSDGFVFCVQTLTNNVGGQGGGLGYLNVTNSVAVEFDTHWNNGFDYDFYTDPTSDPLLPPGLTNAFGSFSDNSKFGDNNHIGIDFNGFITNTPSGIKTNNGAIYQHVTTPLNNGIFWYAWVDYNGGNSNLEVRISTNSIRPSLPTLTSIVNLLDFLHATNAYLGFTAGTGAGYQRHDILSWQFISPYHPIGTTNPVPAVAITSPTNGAVFIYGPPIALQASASEQGGTITNVQFFSGTNSTVTNFLGNAVIGANNTYDLAWTNVLHGTNSVVAVAKDNNGLSSTSTVVYVVMDSPPAVTTTSQTIIWPEGGSSTNVALAGTVSDDGLPYGVTNINWSVINSNGPVTFTSTNTASTTATFTTNGVYVLQLRADDGFATNTTNCTITIQRRSFITITLPTNNAVINSGTPITINATAYDLDGVVTNVQFFNWTTNLLGVIPGETTVYRLMWPNAPHGTNLLSAVATDNSGLNTTSAVVVVIINSPPTVNAGLNQTITLPVTNLTLTGSVTDDGLPQGAPLTTAWSVVSGNGPVTFGNANATNSTASFTTNGLYVLKLTANDTVSTSSSTVTITVNRSPQVSAGSNQIVTLTGSNAMASLAGSFSDDGLPVGAPVTAIWSVVSATNGNVTFGNASLPATTATFTNNGNYVLQLAVNDTVSTNTSNVTITVNRPPTVNAGTNQILIWVEGSTNISTTLAGSMADDGYPYGILTNLWSEISGPGTVTFSPASATNATATFSTNGVYVLQLTANDGAAASSSQCTVSIERRPFVSVVSPTNNATFSFGVPITNLAAAYDLDGSVTNVQFYNWTTNLLGTAVSAGTNYTLIWTNAPLGSNSLTAVAWDNNGLSSTSAPVNLTVVSVATMAVYIAQPSSNSVFVAPGVVPISATVVSNSSSVQLVEFFANGIKVGQDALDSGNPHTFTWVGVASGNYTLTAKATDASANTATSPGIPIHVAQPVSVNAGSNQVVILTNSSATITLHGGTTGGYGAVTSFWSQATGPATAQFANATLTNTAVTFTNLVGNYMLRLTAGDGYSQGSGTVMITVLSNQPPVVNAGPNRIIAPGQAAFLNGSVSDDGLPPPPTLSSVWSVISGPMTNGITFTNANLPVTVASNFTTMGVYTLRLTASDGLNTAYSNMTVTVADPSSRTYTFDADFAEGDLVNVNFDTVPDQLQLNQKITPFPFVCVACTDRGTIARIDANTGQILGEYRTAPETVGTAASPSRTTVDRYGNVWVCNRSDYLEGTNGSITRVGLVIGGTRGYKTNDLGGTNFTFVPNPQGEYLQPPFKYCTAIDRDGDGLIRTSSGLGDVLDWDYSLSGTNNLGGVSAADDECIINYTRTHDTGMRTVAIDAHNDLWVGGRDHGIFEKIDGVTGLLIPNTAFQSGNAYGGLIDGKGVLWSSAYSSAFFRFDIDRRFDMTVNPPAVIDPNYTGDVMSRACYGISIDPQTGFIWYNNRDAGYVGRLNPNDYSYTEFAAHTSLKGLAVDDNGNVWVGNDSSSEVEHFRTDGTFVGLVDLGCGNDLPYGIAVDSNGKVWAACNSGTAVRIDPNSGPRMVNDVLNPTGYILGQVDLTVKLDGPGQAASNPYNYSDMTGFVSLGATEPSGIWRVVHDSGIPHETWGVVQWDSSEPAGTGIKVEVRAADDYLQLSATNNLFFRVTNNVPFSNMTGQFMEIRATFTHKTTTNATPVLYDLTVSSGTNAVVANAANFANSDHATMLENRAPIVINVLSNDIAPLGAQLTITKVSPASSGYVTIRAGATNLLYTPNTNFFGVDQFSYTVSDGQGGVGRAVVTVEVGQAFPPPPTNSGPPTAQNTNVIVFGNSTKNPIDMLSLCADTNNPSLTDSNVYIYSITQASHGYVQVSSCELYYTPNAGYFGPDSFTYTIRNSVGLTASAKVNVTVTGQSPIQITCGFNTNSVITTNNSTLSFNNNGDPNLCANTYTFAGEPNQAITISITSNDPSIYMQVYDPSGLLINYSPVVASSTNTYTIEVTCDAGNFSTVSNYSLSMSCSGVSVPHMAVLLGTNGVIPNGGGIDFGVTQVGRPISAYLTITNYGNAALTVYSEPWTMIGEDNFTLADTDLTNYWDSMVIQPGGSTNLTVWFEALTAGQTNDVLSLYSDDNLANNYDINLTGIANATNSVPPTVGITNPPPNTTYIASQIWNPGSGISMTATSSPAAGAHIWAVDFYAQSTNGNVPIGQVFSPDWNGNYTLNNWYGVPPGSYKLTAVAIDDSGLQTVSAPVPITVLLRDTNSPVMKVLFQGTNNLPNGSTINFGVVPPNVPVSVQLVVTNLGPGTLTGGAMSIDYGDSGQYYLTNSPFLTNSPQEFSILPGKSTNVTVVFFAGSYRKYDTELYIESNDQGLYGPYNQDPYYYNYNQIGGLWIHLTGTVTNSGIPPSVVITNPAPGSVFYSPSSIPLQALAIPLSGASMSRVEFYATTTNGTADLGQGSFDGVYYDYTWSSPSLGQYTLKAEAIDSSGLATISSPVSMTILARPAMSPVLQAFLGTNVIGNNATIAYSPTTVGTTNMATLTLSNSGNASLIVSNVFVNTYYDNDFFLNAPGQTNFTILAGHSTNLLVSFNPSSDYIGDDEMGTLTLISDDVARNPLVISLSGYGNLTNSALGNIVITNPVSGAIFTSAQTYDYEISITTTSAPPAGTYYESVYIYATDSNGSRFNVGNGGSYNPENGVSANWNQGVPPGSYNLTAVAINYYSDWTMAPTEISTPVPITVLLRDTNSPDMQVFFGTNNLTSGSTINFGIVPTNTPSQVTLTITNLGPGTLTNYYLDTWDNFYLTTNSPQDGFILPAHASTNLTLVFTSASVGQHWGGFEFWGNDEGQSYDSYNDYWGYYGGYYEINLTGITTNLGAAPTVVLTSPSTNSTFVFPNVVPLTATATPNNGGSVSYVYFYAASTNGNVFLGAGSYNYSVSNYSFNWLNATPGQYALTAIAIDNFGQTTISAPIPITVLLRPTNSPVMQVFLSQTNPVPNYSTINCGITHVGTPVTLPFAITNAGNAVLNISKLILSNTNDFSLNYSFDLSEKPLAIPAGASTNFTLFYNAINPGQVSGVLTIYDSDVASQPFYITNTGSANPANGTPPAIQLTAPTNGIQYAFPSDIPLAAVASCATNSTLASINFFTTSPTGSVQIGQVLASPGQTNFIATWPRPALGTYSLYAIAIDHSGLMGQSTNHVVIQVIDPNAGSTNAPATNGPPIARDDYLKVEGVVSNSVTYPINVLANDSSPNGYPLTLTGFIYSGRLGQVTQDGNRLLFTPNPLIEGTNYVYYTISDGRGGTAAANVQIVVKISPLPTIQLVTPDTDGEDIELSTNLPDRNLALVAYAQGSVRDYATNSIVKVIFYDQDQPIGTATVGTNNIFAYLWRTPAAGWHYLAAVCLDNVGQENITPYIHVYIEGKPNNTPPTAAITNLQMTAQNLNGTISQEYPLVTNGIINVLGKARDSDAGDTVSYQLLLQKPDGTVVANITPGADPTTGYYVGTDNNGVLASNVDLSIYQNGAYDIVLNVFDGWEVSSDSVRILLDTQLKIGNFSFSVQDVALPVSGIPLTVTRTYNSFNLNNGEFGYSWTYAINDVNLQLDEVRQDTPDIDDNTFSLRVGGGRDVTLTLPDGRTVTFQFYFDTSHSGAGGNAYAAWQSPPGVTYKLTAFGDPYYCGLTGFWNNDGGTGFDSYDFAGFYLTAQDGTRYVITREDTGDYFFASGDGGDYDENDFYAQTYGAATLTEIDEPNGDKITIGGDEVDHLNPAGTVTRSIRFQRDDQNRIVGILDPNAGTNGLPVMKYVYDDASGNLVNAMRLTSTNGLGTYDVTTYQYTNSHFPHFMTGIIDPRGIPMAENFYDSSGRLIAVQDANGNLTQFSNNPTNNIETIIDRLGRTNSYVYDLRGNVIAQTNALGQITTMAYDGNNNETNQVTYLNGQPYATNNYLFDTNNLLLTSTDPLGHTNVFTYDGNGHMLTSTDARGISSTNVYDPSTGNLLSTVDALGHSTTNIYNNGLLVSSANAIGTVSTSYYDSAENQIASATLDAAGNILSTNSATFDANGNRLTSTVWRRVNGSWMGATTAYIYDAMNRVVQTVDPNGGTNMVVYEAGGQQQSTIDKLGRTISYIYDSQSRLVQTTYPDLTTETTAYDAAGNRTNSVDHLGRTTTYVYDALNRLVHTIYPDGTTNTTVYDGVGRVAQSIDARGTITAFAYDAAGRRLAVTNAFGITGIQTVSSYGYDADGNQITFTDANQHTTTNVFDVLNRQVAVDYANGTKMFTGYDAGGRRMAGTNQDNIVTRFGYDGAGRLLVVTNALGTAQQTVTRYQYDEAGNQTAQIDALNRTNTYAYDNMGRRISHAMPGGQREGFAYDWNGNLLYATNFNGAVITNQYDVMNRLTNMVSVNGYKAGYTYTATGQRATMTDASGVTSYSYDNRDRLLLKTASWNNGPTVSLNYLYDLNSNVTNIWSSTANGVNLAYSYDPLSRLTNVLANGGAAASYGFDLAGNLQAMRYGDGVTNLYQYDSLNRLTNLTATTVSGTIASFYYQMGSAGNRTNLSEKVGIGATTRTYSWNYDALYRLTNENISVLGNLGYGYDSVGNRTNRASSVSGLANQTPTYNTNDWLNSDQYDANGNTTNSSGNFYQYDVMNHVTNVNSGTILVTYDGDGNRVSKKVGGTTTYYLLDGQNPSGYVQVLEEYQGSSLSKVYNYGMDLISQRVPNTSTNYFIYDGHGSTRMLTDIGGNVVNAFAYDAYGTLIASNAAPQTMYLYSGQQFDSDLGFYYNRARYLNPNTGRFWTMDSNEGSKEDPLSLHKYLYGGNNPVNMVDPSGHDDMVDMLCTMAIQSGLSSMVMPVVSSALQGAGMMLIPHQILDAIENEQAPDCEMFGGSLGGSVGRGGVVASASGSVEGLFSIHNLNSALFLTTGLSLSSGKSGGGVSLYAGCVWNCDSSEDYAQGVDISVTITGKALPQKLRTAFANLETKYLGKTVPSLTGTFGDLMPLGQQWLDVLNAASSNNDINSIDNFGVTISWSPTDNDFSVVVGREMGNKGNFGKGSAGPGGWALGVSQSYQMLPRGRNVMFK